MFSGFRHVALSENSDIQAMLFQCWATVVDGGPTLKQHCVHVSWLLGITNMPPILAPIVLLRQNVMTSRRYDIQKYICVCTQQPRDIGPMLVHCWTSVKGSGQTINQLWFNVPSCCAGHSPFGIINHPIFLYSEICAARTFKTMHYQPSRML